MKSLTASLKSFFLMPVFAFCFVCFEAQITPAQKSQAAIFVETLAQAEAKTQARGWPEAAVLWEQVVQMNPVNGRFWNQLGAAFYNAKEYRKSTAAYEKALALGFSQPAVAAYNIACNYALLGEKEQALKWLEKAFALKFLNLQHAQTDTDLQSLHGDPRF